MKHPLNIQRIATATVRIILILTVVVYLAFFLVGFNLPYLFNPQQNAPLLTGAVITLMLLLLGFCVATVLWSTARQIKNNRHRQSTVGHLLASRRTLVRWAVAVCIAISLLLTYTLASTSPLVINNQSFSDTLQLRLANMFTATTLVSIILAAAAVLFSRIRNKQ